MVFIDYKLITYLFIFLEFSYFAIFEDFKTRKVSNKLNLYLFSVSFFLFIINIFNYSIYDYIAFIAVFLIGFIFYYLDWWGGADGKIFISLSLILISIQGSVSIFNFLINTFIYYLIVILFLVLFMTSKKSKIKALININYLEKIFLIINVFIIFSTIFLFFFANGIKYENLLEYFFYFIVLIIVIYPILKLFINKLNKEVAFFLNLILFLILFLIYKFSFISYFFLLLFIRIMFDFITNLADLIKVKNKKYDSAFSVYLFSGAIFTLISNSNFIFIFVDFLKNNLL